jgi:hypothetical protein
VTDDASEKAVTWARVASTIGSLLTVAFLAWAGVVWQGWQDVRDMLFKMNERTARIEVWLGNHQEDYRELRESLDRHSGQESHDKFRLRNHHFEQSGK